MKIEVVFSAESAADVTKLITTLQAFKAGLSEEAPDPAEVKTRKRKPVKEEAPAEDAFDFEADFNEEQVEDTTEKVDLDKIRTIVNAQAEKGLKEGIVKTMGSFSVKKLSELKKEQYDTFYKAIKNLK